MVRDQRQRQVFVDRETVGAPKPTYERWQWGASLGGPIVKRPRCSSSGRTRRTARIATARCSSAPSSARRRRSSRTAHLRGRVHQPVPREAAVRQGIVPAAQGHHIRGDLQLAQRDRHPRLRRPGRTTASRPRRTCGTASIRSRANGRSPASKFLNETYLSYQRYRWNPTAENYEIIGLNFSGLLRIGGRDTEPAHGPGSARRCATTTARFFSWHGNHTAKIGGVARASPTTTSTRSSTATRSSRYAATSAGTSRARRSTASGNPDLSASNFQFGVFAQDDWAADLPADGEPRPPLGLRVWHDQQQLRHAGGRAHRDRVVRRRRRVLHRRRRSSRRSTARGSRGSACRTTCAATAARCCSAASAATSTASSTTGRSPSASRLQYAVRTFQFSRAAASATACRRSSGIPST